MLRLIPGNGKNKMRYAADQEGILRRYLRETDNWQRHLNNSKSFIISTLKSLNYQSVAFLGSGWLLDVPYQELSDLDKQIWLYDIRHPGQIRNKIAKYKNINLVEMDLTGGLIEIIHDSLRNSSGDEFIKNLPDIIQSVEYPDIQGEVVVSLNLLDQLDGIIIDYLKPRFNMPEKYWINLRKLIQQNHLHLLQKHKSLLIADLEEKIQGFDGVMTNSLIHAQLPAYKNRISWDWTFDTSGSYYKNKTTIFKVIALEL